MMFKACLPHLDPMVMNSTSGNISYPLVDYILFNKQECKWLIMVPKEKLIVFRLQKLVVVSGDYLVVRDGRKENAVILKNFTSKPDIKEKWISQGQYLLVKFKSDELNAGKEFELIWESMDRRKACSHLSTETIKGDVSTLNGPYVDKHYPNNHECTWIINVSRRRVVAFVLKKFDLAKGDYLEIRDGKSENAGLLKNYTTKATSLVYKLRVSTGQYLRVKFKSDHQYVGKGFIIMTVPQPKPTTPFPPLRTTSWTKLASTITTTPQFDPAPNTSYTNTDATAVSSSADLGMGLGFGLVALIVISSLLCLYIRKKRIKRRSKNINEPWEIALSQVELLEELGQGAFGKVWKGRMYRRLLESDDTDKSKHKLIKNRQDMVAVKTLHDGATAEQRNEFLREIEFMKDVGCHRNIISMVACCTKDEQVFLVVELAQHGDLLQLLKGKRKSTYVLQAPPKTGSNSGPDSGDEDTKQENVQSLLDDFMSFAWQIAQGMEYLSSKGIVHRDLAARNILVADDRVVKVADFGLSRHMSYVDQVYQAQGRHKLPLKWMSPEAIDDQIFTSKSDVWSYGVVLWEIYSMGKLPYRTVCNQRLLAMLKKGHRMDKPDLCPDDVYQIMKNCWQEHAQDRPSFSHVIQTIEMLMTRDTPYVELMNMEMNEWGDRYLMPVDDSDSESDVSETVV